MSFSQNQALITLIEKKEKDHALSGNWRPISLVNVDTEIMSKVITSIIIIIMKQIQPKSKWFR